MITFNVPEMNCGHCTAKIAQSVQQTDPTALLSFDLTSRQVEIDSADDGDVLLSAIKLAGFEATPA
ncbi:Copper chaperone [Thalassovita gelatinovora]|uniref:Copper chaperone n=1 Tax=Thalassovita gelatinovora TaxID=53501 RepID=A0A0P1FHT2_THAGE|nr:heavy-metal-associated domain-containing protein [Thalassovita gelatinovora]QIZ82056.1 heavy-metal-associated domain-containing protein [Thalassovita gelatinovora]CUH67561.1 Copper chaperone [Thalassovita gelatinovora]SEP71764.1 copper chaperone [Thalassovita gelatinovora]